MKKVTIKDVAKKAGVSISIVSFALNNVEGRVSEKIRQKVLACADELGYVPNSYARQMRSKRSNTIALVYPRLHFEEKNSGTVELVSWVCKCADAKNLDVLIKLSDGKNPDSFKRECLELSLSKKVDGIIVYSDLAPRDFFGQLTDSNVNYVHITENKPPIAPKSICLDNYVMMYDVVKFIRGKGYEEIYLLYTRPSEGNHARTQGFLAAVSDLRMEGGALYCPGLHRNQEELWNELKAVVLDKKNKIAVVCWNDAYAINIMEILKRHHVKIPENVGIMGVDDLSAGEHITPGLTTLKQPFDEIARAAVDILYASDQGQACIDVSAAIVERESI